jgi:hypothetical protein
MMSIGKDKLRLEIGELNSSPFSDEDRSRHINISLERIINIFVVSLTCRLG